MNRGAGKARAYMWLISLVLGMSCTSSPPPEGAGSGQDVPDPTPLSLPAQIAMQPDVASIGHQATIRITGVSTAFSEDTSVSLGDGVEVLDVQVLSPSELVAELSVLETAVPGYRTLAVTSAGETLSLPAALLVQRGAISIDPARADRGQTVDIQVHVEDVTMTAGYTWLDLGEGTTTRSFEIVDDNLAVARVTVASDASIGSRVVSLQNGPDRVLLPEGFLVDRGLIAITFSPPVVSQGDVVQFVVEGTGTHFEQGKTALDAGLGILVDASSPDTFIVESPTRITGTMEVCQSAVPGAHFATVTTSPDDAPPEIVTSLESFDVLELPVSPDRAIGSFYLGLSRMMREGLLIEAVYASATFRVQVQACGTSTGTSCGVTTLPDQPAFYPPPGCTPTPNTTLYPPTPTLDAGDHVYFEVDGGPSIQLDRHEDADGYIYYAPSVDIPVEDFVFDTGYDIRAEGGAGEEAIAAFVERNALVTPPSDFRLVEPDLRYAPTLDRYDSVPVRWTDSFGNPGAHTAPVAGIYSRLRTTEAVTGAVTEIRMVPIDDGEFVFPAEYVSMLNPGAGRFLFQVTRLGMPFTIGSSPYISSAVTAVSYDGYFELRD